MRFNQDELERALGVPCENKEHHKPVYKEHGATYIGFNESCTKRDAGGYPVATPNRALAITTKGSFRSFKIAAERDGRTPFNVLNGSFHFNDDPWIETTEKVFLLFCEFLRSSDERYYNQVVNELRGSHRHNMRVNSL